MESFAELLRSLPRDAGMAFVLIQHLDPKHPSYLSEALSRFTSVPVHEIRDEMRVEPNHVYVIPSDSDVGILHGALTLLPRRTEERKPHLPIDFFFKALAADRGNQAIGVVLSGMGSDGTEGLRAIKAAEGVTFAQVPGSAAFSGMPEAAVKGGVVDFVLPIPELARELVRVVHHPFLRGRDVDVLTDPSDESDLKKVLVLIRNQVGADFSEYKLASIRRRIARRMALRRLTTLREYVHALRDDSAEIKGLFEDILIHVTSFFRDGEAFERLKEHVFPEILRQKRDHGGAIRIWSVGCSTGEEVYSLVMPLLELLDEENASDVPVQVFGTDIGERAIEKARAGWYPDAAVRDIRSERLARFFTKHERGGYSIAKSVRERCAFVRHDVTSDPPFSKLDLVSCRNVLIYLGPELQKRVLATFHFALNEPGFLLLGRAENVVDSSSLFRLVDKENKIFARTAVKSTLHLSSVREMQITPQAPVPGARAGPPLDIVRRSESLLLDAYAPPGVIVNERMEILHFRGRTGPYLEPAPGQPQHDLIKMARKGLAPDIRIAISEAKQRKTAVRRVGVHFEQNGAAGVCSVVVLPIASPPESREATFAVLFEEPKPSKPLSLRDGDSAEADAVSKLERESTEHGSLVELETELHATKGHLQSLIEDHQHSTTGLQTANEELISSNEELQSLNEELQTAKEELQSTNEELSTLNEELQTRNGELNSVNSDLVNILASVEVPIVIVDASRCIRRFTPKARPIMNLLPSDVGRPIDDIRPSLALENLDEKIAAVVDSVTVHEEEVQDRSGRWFRLQIRPYTTLDKRIDGAVISVVDIDFLKRALDAAEWARDYARAIVEAVRTPLLVLDEKLVVVSTNEAFERLSNLTRAATEGRHLFETLSGLLSFPEVGSALQRVAQREERFDGLEIRLAIPARGERVLSLSGGHVVTPGEERLLILSIDDVTELRRRQAERDDLLHDTQAARASAEDANRTKDLFLATLSHELRTPLSTLLGQAQLLRRAKLDEEGIRKASAVIERATKAQAQLIDDLLDISRISTGKMKMDLRAVDLATAIGAAVDMIGIAAEKKHIDVRIQLGEPLPRVSGDAARLQQVVTNLLTNAIKFTEAGGSVTVALDSFEGRARIRVSDTGIGIEPTFLPEIFDRFSQEVRGQTRRHGGLGLGLAIVRYVVEAHGGSVEVESAGKGKGATFTVLLPLMTTTRPPAPEAEPAPLPLGAGQLENISVLVVEDDEGTRDALTEMLRLAGADVRGAESAARAMVMLETFRPLLLVCDIAMPEEDGYSLLRRVRALGPERGGDVPAIAVTALASEDDRSRALDAGFQVHVAKPVDVDRLVATIVELIRQRADHGETSDPPPL
ncbi:MAG: PAS domain-containing protein [Labilithrix sp.]|nr:PAS domain-containing protein [Labilithrix sp.]